MQKWLIPKKWQHYLRIKQDVLINGTYHSFNETVHDNDEITLIFDFPPRSADQIYLPGHRKIDIAYEDNDILVVNKAANIKTHPNLATENDSLFNDVQAYLSPNKPYMVHRIDMLTTGLVLIAKTPYLVPILNRQLTKKILQRQYLAIVDLNKPIGDQGTIDLPIGRDQTDKRKREVIATGDPAQTAYKVLKKSNRFALLKLNLHTGRTHQIRVHLAASNWPIVNDELYNSAIPSGNMMLTAYKLQYQIPFSNKTKIVEISPTAEMRQFIQDHNLT